jgi:gamma-glutamyl:cysteine ligase YbdK (ATP-grasp superfamily)
MTSAHAAHNLVAAGTYDEYESIVDAWLRAGSILDRGMMYWDVRLSERQPTLEFRIADVAATPEEAVLLAVLARGLAATALDDDAPPPDLPCRHAPRKPPGTTWRTPLPTS